VLIGRGIVAIARRSTAIGIATGAGLLALLSVVTMSQLGMTTKADYRALGTYLREEAQAGDGLIVVHPYNERAVRFYAGDRLQSIAPDGVGDGQAAAAIARYPRVWLVRAEAEQYDPADAVATWLEGHATHTSSRAWTGVRVDGYIPNDRLSAPPAQ
jgi:hypothetical protein